MKGILILLMFSATVFFGCGGNCSDKQSEYRDGFSNGQIVSFSSENVSCREWIERMNWNESKATDCWCAGFNDGKTGKENKYPKSN